MARFSRWLDKKVWHEIFVALCQDADFEEVFLDSTIVRAHQHAASVAKKGRKPLADLVGINCQDLLLR